MKVMLKNWDKQFPGRLETIFTSLQNVAPSQLADKNLFDFKGLMHGTEFEDSILSSDTELDVLTM
jgi:tRNA 2-thiocytidine biosynthesis protein TtcA